MVHRGCLRSACVSRALWSLLRLSRSLCLLSGRAFAHTLCRCLSPAVSECRSVEQCQGSVRPVSGQCRGSVWAVSGQCRLTLVSGCRAVSGQCRSSVGQCRGFLTVDLLDWRRAVSECRSVGVSECRAVSKCRSVGVSRPYELLTMRLI